MREFRSGFSFFASLVLVFQVAGAHAETSPVVEGTLQDFHIPGTQVGDVASENYYKSGTCFDCHSRTGTNSAPGPSWSGSLMAHAGRDPLFKAQMATAEQDVKGVGYFCQRCHLPLSIASGHANTTDGTAIDKDDLDGINCHFCHSMIDPLYKAGVSPERDLEIVGAILDRPLTYGNGQFILDPEGVRRAPRPDAQSLHQVEYSPFHTESEFCGTCHDIGNPETTRVGSEEYEYNALDTHAPDSNPHMQFPLQRTYSEWKLSEFSGEGVAMGGRFGGDNAPAIRTCQDCHMPRSEGRAAAGGLKRKDLRSHEFAGAAVGVLDMIVADNIGNSAVDPAAIARVRASSLKLLKSAATVKASRRGSKLKVRVINQTGHKLPTGHSEGRRIWLTLQFLGRGGVVLETKGKYDTESATLDGSSTVVYEMEMGISESAALATGLHAGPKISQMSLANKVFKDNRIPPRGFANQAYSDVGAGVVGWTYADGQYWDDSVWTIPRGTSKIIVTLNYQSLPREYIEALRDSNTTNDSGERLYQLWNATGRGAPIEMARRTLSVKRGGDRKK